MPEYEAHKVLKGECVSSIAKQSGLKWETIWNDGKNSQLKELRRDPNVLMPGDLLYIRKKEKKEDPCAPEQRHRFRALNQPAMLRLRVLRDGQPQANKPYKLEVGNKTLENVTDADGKLEQPIPNDAGTATLTVGAPPDPVDVYNISLGHVPPAREVVGAQHRLFNMGYYHGPFDGVLGPETQTALREFQKKYQLPETGQLDSATGAKLVSEHGG